jgi:hypothetical protein
MLQAALERVVGWGDAPVGDDVGLHAGKMALPGGVGRGTDFKIGEVGFAGESEQGDFALLDAPFQIVHDESGLVRVLDVKLGLCAGDFETQMEPDAFRNIHRAGETRAVENLPWEVDQKSTEEAVEPLSQGWRFAAIPGYQQSARA